jgi:hypothetical protein
MTATTLRKKSERAQYDTTLSAIDIPGAVVTGVKAHYRLSGAPRVFHLTKLTAAEVFAMQYVGYGKLQDTQRILARHGYTLHLDRPLSKEEIHFAKGEDLEGVQVIMLGLSKRLAKHTGRK